MISHHEAEALISARLDQQLDPLTERELSAHLATCPQCRAFAKSTGALASGLRELPYLPPSPAVSQGVMARVDQGRSPWMGLESLLRNPGPAVSTLAIIAVVLLLGFFVLNRFVLDGGDPSDHDHQQLASQPTVVPDTPAAFEVPGTPEPTATEEPPTETPEPTATDEPEPTETEAPEPTATEEPKPTETEEPVPTATEEPVPTETEAPEPTATEEPEPTETEAPEPTETEAPEPTATEEMKTVSGEIESSPEPVNLTGTIEDATEPATAPPSPTEPPAATEPAPESTPTPTESDESPPIEPLEGEDVVEAPEDVEETSTAQVEETPVDPDDGGEEVSIEPVVTGDGTGSQRIEPIDGTEPEETSTSSAETPGATEEATVPAVPGDARDLAASSQPYGGIAGDPSGRLALDGGRMEYRSQAHPAFLTSGEGITAGTTSTDGGQAVTLCVDDECTDVSSESAEGPATDTPLSWANGSLLYARNADGTITYHALVPDESGTAAANDTVLYDGSTALEPTFPVYWAEGRVWVITQGAGWLALTESTAQLYENTYASPQLLRFAPTDEGAIVGYVADGRVIVAPVDAPGAPIGSAPFSGVDFDVSPGVRQIVVSTGAAIEVYDLDGTLVATYASPDMQPGTVLWLNSGIVYQDDASGVLMEIPDPQT